MASLAPPTMKFWIAHGDLGDRNGAVIVPNQLNVWTPGATRSLGKRSFSGSPPGNAIQFETGRHWRVDGPVGELVALPV